MSDEGANVFVATKTRCAYGFSGYKNGMEISYDSAKRDATLANRGLDFTDAEKLFEGRTITIEDVRIAYPEPRFITAGYLGDRVVIVVWTPTSLGRRIISMRHSHAREARKWRDRMD